MFQTFKLCKEQATGNRQKSMILSVKLASITIGNSLDITKLIGFTMSRFIFICLHFTFNDINTYSYCSKDIINCISGDLT